ncbi:MAG: F0F1 ATP synthase subunit delta [Chloroflexi bacterium]|nr:MAG: F0F1 ATP synthase subunit delta [Chloroflexota bacterium]
MAVRGVAKRYARAVFDLAQEAGTIEAVQADLTTLANAVTDRVVGAFLTDPSVHEADKINAVRALFTGPEQQLTRSLAQMLVQRRRIDAAPEILEVYRDLALEARGIAIADVTTAVELSEQERAEVRQRLGSILGKQIELRTNVDPEIIGGLVARVGDQLIDGSVTTQLRAMRAALAH